MSVWCRGFLSPSHGGGYRLFLTASLGIIDYAYSLTPGFKEESADAIMVYSCTPWGGPKWKKSWMHQKMKHIYIYIIIYIYYMYLYLHTWLWINESMWSWWLFQACVFFSTRFTACCLPRTSIRNGDFARCHYHRDSFTSAPIQHHLNKATLEYRT